MTTAFVYPGQGTGMEAMLHHWHEASSSVRRLMICAADCTGVPVERLFARGGRALGRTELLQPVLTAVVLGIHEELAARGLHPDAVTGHSLGEVAALAAAGCLPAEAAVALAAYRGRLMARQAARYPGGMVALAVPTPEEADEALQLARAGGIAAIAAHNAPDQWVISGEMSALRLLRQRYAATPLPVAGPWHSEAMRDAVVEFRTAVSHAVTHEPAIPLVCNRNGSVVRRVEDLAEVLAGQLIRPVAWTATMHTLLALHVSAVVIPGPGKVMRSLVRQNLGAAVAVRAVELPDHLESLREVSTL